MIATIWFLALVQGAFALDTIVSKGNAFWNSKTNERFYLRGVDYQPGGSSSLRDPLSAQNCKRDIPYLKELGINTIRVYQIDNTNDHSECMKLLEEAGIYLLLDVNTATNSIWSMDTQKSYTAGYLQQVFKTMDIFSKYDNVLGFVAGNEVVDKPENIWAAVYVKAVIRDMKRYQTARKLRKIPIGYSATDLPSSRIRLAHYFNCGDESVRSDFYSLNQYEWCGSSDMETSGYRERMKQFADISIPIFFSEFGCNSVPKSSDGGPDRPFTEIEAIYSPEMTKVISGGLVYEYSQEPNNYGLVKIDGDKVTKLKNFESLKAEYKKTPNPQGDGGASKNDEPSKCPENADDFKVTNDLPKTPSDAEILFKEGSGAKLPNAPKDSGDKKKSSDDSGSESSGSSGSAKTDTSKTDGIPKPTKHSKSGSAQVIPSIGLMMMTIMTAIVMF